MVLVLVVVVGLVFGAPLAYAQTAPAPEDAQAPAQAYEPLNTLDTGEIPPLHPLLGIYQWDSQSYSLTTQTDGTVVLSAVSVEPKTITAAAARTSIADDKIYRLKQFATGLMLVLAGTAGLVSVRTKPAVF